MFARFVRCISQPGFMKFVTRQKFASFFFVIRQCYAAVFVLRCNGGTNHRVVILSHFKSSEHYIGNGCAEHGKNGNAHPYTHKSLGSLFNEHTLVTRNKPESVKNNTHNKGHYTAGYLFNHSVERADNTLPASARYHFVHIRKVGENIVAYKPQTAHTERVKNCSAQNHNYKGNNRKARVRRTGFYKKE